MLTTSITLHRKPKDGKDGVGITSADVVFAQSKSSTNPPADTDVWKTNVKELSLVDGYLWSGTKIIYSNKNIAITGKYCIGSTRDFTDIEELYYLSDSGDKIPTNVTFQSSFKPEKGKYLWTCIRYRFKAQSGSAENTNWVYSTPTCAGYFGDDGEDALNIELSVEKILFSYYEGNFEQKNKTITLIVRQGGNVIKSSDYNVKIVAAQNFNISTGDKLTITKQDNYCTLNCFSSGVIMYDYTYDNKVSYVSYPASSCSIKIAVEYNGITYFKELSIEVSFVRMYGGLAYDLESLSSTYGELVGDNGRLKQMETQIYQNARNITLTAKRTDGLENQYSEIKVQYESINISVGKINDGLASTGINLTDGSITMTANKFKLYNNNGDKTFSTDADGNGIFKGTITATGGSFGSFQITSYTDGTDFKFYGMSAHTDGTTVIASSTFTVDYYGLYIGSGSQDNGGSVWIGNNGRKTGNDFSWDDGVIKVDADNSGVNNADISGIGVNVVGNSSHSAIGMKVSATGGKNNYAVYAKNGDFRAENGAFVGVHRGNVTMIDRDYTLQKTDSTIICINKNKGITINLPSDAEPGTFYRIIKRGQTVTFKSNTMNISFVSYGDVVSSVSSGKEREWINCFWDGEYWYVEMSGN